MSQKIQASYANPEQGKEGNLTLGEIDMGNKTMQIRVPAYLCL